MRHPTSVLFDFIEANVFDLKSLIRDHESDFFSFCKITFPDRKKFFAFYSVKSKELARSNPSVVIQDIASISFYEEQLGNIFPQYVDWFILPRFTPVIKNEIKVILEGKEVFELQLIWIIVNGKYIFLTTNFLK